MLRVESAVSLLHTGIGLRGVDGERDIAGLAVEREQVTGEVGGGVDGHIGSEGVDGDRDARGVGRGFGALVVGGGGAYGTVGITHYGQPLDVDRTAAYAFIWLSGASDIDAQGVADYLVGVKHPDGVARHERQQIAGINKCADRVEPLAFEKPPHHLFLARAVAVWLFAEGFVDGACGCDARTTRYVGHLKQGYDGFAVAVDGCGKLPGCRAVDHIGGQQQHPVAGTG